MGILSLQIIDNGEQIAVDIKCMGSVKCHIGPEDKYEVIVVPKIDNPIEMARSIF